MIIGGQLEIDIMNTVWSMQEADEDANISISDIVSSLESIGIKRAYTTIKTVMDRLVAKEILVRYKFGKKYFYKSMIDRTESRKHAIDNVSGQFFNGDYVKMVRFIEKQYEEILV